MDAIYFFLCMRELYCYVSNQMPDLKLNNCIGHGVGLLLLFKVGVRLDKTCQGDSVNHFGADTIV